jgi:hypothetical protein
MYSQTWDKQLSVGLKKTGCFTEVVIIKGNITSNNVNWVGLRLAIVDRWSLFTGGR